MNQKIKMLTSELDKQFEVYDAAAETLMNAESSLEAEQAARRARTTTATIIAHHTRDLLSELRKES